MSILGVKNRMTFQVLKNGYIVNTHTLVLNPEEYSHEEPARVNINRTLSSAYIEEWGRDLMVVNLRGTTGRRVYRNGKQTSGYEAFKDLRQEIYRYFLEPDGNMKQRVSDKYEMKWYNWEDEEYYYVYPTKFSLLRSKTRPLLYAYDMSMILLRGIGDKMQEYSPPDPISKLDQVYMVASIASLQMAILTDKMRLLMI
jgi:hypothetical protein